MRTHERKRKLKMKEQADKVRMRLQRRAKQERTKAKQQKTIAKRNDLKSSARQQIASERERLRAYRELLKQMSDSYPKRPANAALLYIKEKYADAAANVSGRAHTQFGFFHVSCAVARVQ